MKVKGCDKFEWKDRPWKLPQTMTEEKDREKKELVKLLVALLGTGKNEL